LQLLELAQGLLVEPRVVERQTDLVGRRLDERDLTGVEAVGDLPAEREGAEDPAAAADRDADEAADLVEPGRGPRPREEVRAAGGSALRAASSAASISDRSEPGRSDRSAAIVSSSAISARWVAARSGRPAAASRAAASAASSRRAPVDARAPAGMARVTPKTARARCRQGSVGAAPGFASPAARAPTRESPAGTARSRYMKSNGLGT